MTRDEIERGRPVERDRCSGAAASAKDTGSGGAAADSGVVTPVLHERYGRRRGEAALATLGGDPEGFHGGRLG